MVGAKNIYPGKQNRPSVHSIKANLIISKKIGAVNDACANVMIIATYLFALTSPMIILPTPEMDKGWH